MTEEPADSRRVETRRVETRIEGATDPRGTALASPHPRARVTTYSETTEIRSVGDRARQLVWLVAGIVAGFLALDFVLRAAGANSESGFVQIVERVGAALSAPFAGAIGDTMVSSHPIRWADALGLVVFVLAAWAVVRLLRIVAPHPGRSAS